MTDESKRLLKLLRTYHNGTYAKAIDEALELASYPQIKWIPCEERLPERDGKYMTTVDCVGEMVIMMLDYVDGWNCVREAEGTVYRKYEIFDVIAWRPAPEPYREERKDDE